jgi:nitrile hydratase
MAGVMSRPDGSGNIGRKRFPHDMGGQADDTVICSGTADANDDAVFEQDWHGRALAITVLSGAHGKWTLDESRHARECLLAEDYRRFSYYEKWLAALANLLVKHGLVDRDELVQGHARTKVEAGLRQSTLAANEARSTMEKGNPTIRLDQTLPKFKIGESVTTLKPEDTAWVEDGHTRLPSYGAERRGVIIKYYGSHILPDSHAHGMGEQPEHLYAVEFNARDLWGKAAEDGDKVVIDCWESYLR